MTNREKKIQAELVALALDVGVWERGASNPNALRLIANHQRNGLKYEIVISESMIDANMVAAVGAPHFAKRVDVRAGLAPPHQFAEERTFIIPTGYTQVEVERLKKIGRRMLAEFLVDEDGA